MFSEMIPVVENKRSKNCSGRFHGNGLLEAYWVDEVLSNEPRFETS